MAILRRLSHVGFNVPRELFVQECDFWQNVMGLTYTHGIPGDRAFFTSDPSRDHEFILYAVDTPPDTHFLNHLAFDVVTDDEVTAFTERLRAAGYEVEDRTDPTRRRQNKVTSPAGIHFEVNTPPYMAPKNPLPLRQERTG